MTTAIDVSLLPPPEAIKPLSYAAIKAERLTSLTGRFEAAGLPYDVASIEGDAAVALQEEDAWRELLDKGAVNDAVRAVLAGYARGTNLDNVVARANIARITITPANPATGAAAIVESDTSLLRRYLASFSAPAAGSDPGYIARALAAYPLARDIRVFGPDVHGDRGRVEIVLLAPDGAPSPSVVADVYAALHKPGAKGTTDVVSVFAATIAPWSCAASVVVGPGPDPSLVRAEAEAAIRRVADEYFRIGSVMPANIVPGVLRVANVVSLAVASPLVDIGGVGPARLRTAPRLVNVALTSPPA